MSSTAQAELMICDGQAGSPKSSSGALVPLPEPARWSRRPKLPPPDPGFVAQLIANAERFSHTRSSPGESADAISAYRAHQRRPCDAGRLTRQMI
ncbi:hypothetical protein [Bradyrhizobium sp. ARR65]|uniref:hypothetical protein n=1 Tax=Bradyrhizobium sp. ARR65 TaxID=1040989 RepID=UPI00055449EE|nr:hypothetical protein [Bradyrhizobium sp. ARR65]